MMIMMMKKLKKVLRMVVEQFADEVQLERNKMMIVAVVVVHDDSMFEVVAVELDELK